MSRRHRAERREITPDAKFGDLVLAKFMNSLMYDGKKSAAEGIIYGAFDTIAAKTKQDPLVVFHEALRNVSPALEVRSRRVGGATYQVPVEVRTDRSRALAAKATTIPVITIACGTGSACNPAAAPFRATMPNTRKTPLPIRLNARILRSG